MRAGLWHTNNQTDSSNSPLFIRVPTLWKLNKVLVPTLPRHTCQAHAPGYPYIQSMPKDTLWFHKNTRCLHTFLSLLMLQMVSTGSKPEPQEMIIPEFSVLRFSAIWGHLLLFVHPAGGADSPTGTSQPHGPWSQQHLEWDISMSLLYPPAQEVIPVISLEYSSWVFEHFLRNSFV